MKKNIEYIKYWGQLLLLPIYWFSFLIPRDKNIWLFGSTFGRRFADNPRYLYLYTHQACKNIRAVWISHNKKIVNDLRAMNYEAYYYLSLKGIFYCLIGKVYVYDNYTKDINFWTSGGALKVNLWHGVGNKRINYDNEYDLVRHPKSVWEKFLYFPRRLSDEKPHHYILATSQTMKKIFKRAFQVDDNHIIVAGYPRNDILYRNHRLIPIYLSSENLLNRKLLKLQKEKKKIVAYIPTFRKTEIKLKKILNLEVFNCFLNKNNMTLFIKLHPKSQIKETLYNHIYSNIEIIDADIDINLFLKKFDILITDYSSVYSDFMLLDRPVIAFQYDQYEYLKQTRGTYFKFEQYMPELRAETMEELMDCLLYVFKQDICRKKRRISRQVIFGNPKPNSCNELIKEIRKLLLKDS